MRQRGLITWLLTGILLLGLGSIALADTKVLDSNGNLHRVFSEDQGRSLTYLLQHPDGTVVSRPIPGTTDPVQDIEPYLTLDTDGVSVVLVWSRVIGGNFDVAAARCSDEEWNGPRIVSTSAHDDRQPHAEVFQGGYIRIIWLNDDGTEPLFLNRFLDRNLVPLIPEYPLTTQATVLDLEGQTGTTDPIDLDRNFLFLIKKEGRHRLVLFGGRDEPSPLPGRMKRLDLLLPVTIDSCGRHRASEVAGRLFVRVETASGLLYTIQSSATDWSAFRRINQSDLPMEAAELLVVEEMLSTQAVK